MRRAGAVGVGLAVATLVACSPVYVAKAGLAEIEILGGRRPLAEVVLDPETDPRTRDLLTFVMEARTFARDELALDIGESYTSYVERPSDTLALVLSAARRDRLASITWWFPIVGHVPYRGFFDEEEALAAQRELEADGYDTYLRPTAAFSTLGWFDDPLLSTVLGADEAEAVATVLHELSHNHLFVPGRVQFNESFANFVGRAGAAEFFCTRQGGGPDTVKCRRAQARWRDTQRFSRFLGGFLTELEGLYADSTRGPDEKIRDREAIFEQARDRFRAELSPTLESLGFGGFLSVELNNATVLARLRYFHRLPDFQRLLEARGGVREAIAFLAEEVGGVDDPFSLLPNPAAGSGEPGTVRGPPKSPVGFPLRVGTSTLRPSRPAIDPGASSSVHRRRESQDTRPGPGP